MTATCAEVPVGRKEEFPVLTAGVTAIMLIANLLLLILH